MGLKKITFAVTAFALAFASCAQQEAPTAVRAPVPVKVTKVTKGNIQSTLAFSGEIQALDQVDMVPSSSGRLQQVFVDEGALVKAGTPLAQLETDTLEAQLRQSEANVLSARARLDTILRGARPEEIASAQASLDSQRSRLRALVGNDDGALAASVTLNAAAISLAGAQAKLDQLKSPTASDISVADATLAAATSNFVKAATALDALRNPTTLDIQSAQSSVDSAKAGLTSAQAKLDDLKTSPKPVDLAAAHSTLASAKSTLRSAENTMAALRRPLDTNAKERLFDALVDVTIARNQLAADRSINAKPEVLAADEKALLDALNKLKLEEQDTGTIDTGVSVEQVTSSQASLDSAIASVASAQAKLDVLVAGPTTVDLQTAQASVDSAKATLSAAQTRLDRLKSPTLADISAAQATVEASKTQQLTAQKTLNELLNPTEITLRTAESTKAAADAAYARAMSDIEVQQAAVAQAQQSYGLTVDKYTTADVSSATAAVALAEASADLSRIQLSKATLVAPFDAIVAKKGVSVGATVSTQTAVFTIVSQSLQVVFNGAEGSLAQIKTGQPVSLTVAAFGDGKPFRATITSISPVADPTSRTFRIKAIPAADQEGLKAGMFANVVVTTQAQSNTLLVPQEALVQKGQDTVVFIVKDDKAEQRKIQPGLRNDKFVQVRSGVEEDEQVVIQGNRTLRDQDNVAIAK